jgi:flavin-dependent dehydrogenase
MRDGYELYVTPLPDDEILVAALTGETQRRNPIHEYRRWLRLEPELQTWLDGATQSTELLGRAPLLKRVHRRKTPPGLVLLGDAAESTDPVTAGGMSLALLGAASLERHIGAILEGKPAAQRALRAAQAELTRTHRWLGAGLRLLGQLPVAARLARQWMEFHPATMNALIALATTRPR